MSYEIRDEVIDYVQSWSDKTEIKKTNMVNWIGLSRSKYYDWKRRYGKENEHNGWVCRDHWLEDWEKEAICEYYNENKKEGYCRTTYMMMDENIVAVSPASVYRVLKKAGLMRKWNNKKSKKGTGFEQPSKPHQHWHIDISYVNICSTFYYLIAILDGYSRYIVHHEIRESMTEKDAEIVLQRAREKYPEASPRIISDNGPQFIAKDFKQFIRIMGMTHVTTSPYYPQSNGKLERWFETIKKDCIRPNCPLSIEDAKKIVAKFVEYYNNERLHSAIGYVSPLAKLEGRAEEIHAERDRKLAAARELRKRNRRREREKNITLIKSD